MFTASIIRLAYVTVLIAFSLSLQGQEMAAKELVETLARHDSLLFNEGFNKCDIAQLERLVSNDFEFYHDQAGITNTKAAFITSIKERICKLNYRPRRELEKSALEIFPLKKNGKIYGAVETGIHKFYAIEKNKPEHLTSTAKFTHIWLLEGGRWKLSRGYSYDHRDMPNDSDAFLFRDKELTDKWLADKKIPAVGIGFIENGKIKEITVYGTGNNDQPHPSNLIFNVASLTKPVTAMVALKLVNTLKWDLDEPVYKYWTDPDVANVPRSKKLTTRHILSHQTGFANWRYQNTDGKLAFEFEPGTKYQYSGEGFEYLRKALEHKFNKTLDQLASELIFTPLQMNDTRFYWDKNVDESRVAKWYKKDGSIYDMYKNSSANAADDLLTTVEDYSKFLLHVINGGGLNKDLYREMLSPQTQTSKPHQHFGLGWLVDEDVNEGADAVTHGGDDKGVHTIVFMLPESKKGLLIFTNSDHGTDVFIPAIKRYLGKAGDEIIDIETR